LRGDGSSTILYRGEPVLVVVEQVPRRERSNRVELYGTELVIVRGRQAPSPWASLETWLRREARKAVTEQLVGLTRRLEVVPNRVYIMDQRTKWGNCSAMQNLSFSWRLIMAPPSVLEYVVIHETVHLAVPDHSRKFWLTVQSLCPESERARQWLAAN